MGSKRTKAKSTAPAEPVAVLVGRRLAKAREKADLSQTELSREIQRTKSYISMVERGERAPRLEVLLTWSARCGLTLSELVLGLEAEALRQVTL